MKTPEARVLDKNQGFVEKGEDVSQNQDELKLLKQDPLAMENMTYDEEPETSDENSRQSEDGNSIIASNSKISNKPTKLQRKKDKNENGISLEQRKDLEF